MRAVSFFFFMNLLHPRSTLFPYTTLFRSVLSFYHQPWWMILLKVVVIFAFLMLMTLFAIWAERRLIGRMQQRPGPNRAGPFGLLQSLMDGIKLPLKEDIIPRRVDKLLFVIAPA